MIYFKVMSLYMPGRTEKINRRADLQTKKRT